MPITAGALRDLHRIHRQLTDLRERLARGPKQVKAGERNVQHLEEQHDKAKEKLTRSKVLADEKQLQLKERETRIEDLKVKLNSANSNKEYQALKEQIAADEQASSVLSDEILEMLEKIDEHEATTKEAEVKLTNAKSESEKTRNRVNSEQSNLESELVRVSSELEKAEAALPADFKTDYSRIADARGEDALAQVEGEICGGCYQTLTPQMLNELFMSKPVFCKACGRLLYLPEDTSVGGSS